MYSSSGVLLFLPDQVRRGEPIEVFVEFPDCIYYLFEEAVEESPPDDGCGLEDLLHLFIEPVDAGHDHPLDRIGNGDRLD